MNVNEEISNVIKSEFADGLIRQRQNCEPTADFNTAFDKVAGQTFDSLVRFYLKRFARKKLEENDTENEEYKNLKVEFIDDLRRGSFSSAESAFEEAVQKIIKE